MPDNDLLVLIVDDEQPARLDLERMLEKIGGVEIVGEAKDGPEALNLIKELRPDLVLLDIQMPGLDGFQVLAGLDRSDLPRHIIFVTAYDQHALRAFEVHAADYLLKPVEESRLAASISRIRRINHGLEQRPDIDALLRSINARPGRIAVRSGEALVMVDYDDILYVTIEDGEIIVVTGDYTGPAAAFRSLEDILRELPAACFMRVHRSFIANVARIHEIAPWHSGSYRLRMGRADGPVIPLSRAQAKELRKHLKW